MSLKGIKFNDQIIDVPSQLSELESDTEHRTVTDQEKENWNNKSTFSGDYNDLSNKPTIPTKTSELANDSDFVSDSAYVHTDNNYTTAEKSKLEGIESGAEVNKPIDAELSTTSENPVQNKVITTAINDILTRLEALENSSTT